MGATLVPFDIVLILALIMFILGLITGVTLAKPTITT
jgi:hypothetical protein